MNLIMKIDSDFKTQEELDGILKHLYVDDIVFSVNDKNIHLDFSKFGYIISEGKLIVKVSELGTNWDDLNKDEGISCDEINVELLSKGYINNYVILSEINKEYISKYDKEKFTSDGLYKGFKLLEIGYCGVDNEKILFKIDKNAQNAEGL